MNDGAAGPILTPESFWGNSLRKRSICKILEVIKLFNSSPQNLSRKAIPPSFAARGSWRQHAG